MNKEDLSTISKLMSNAIEELRTDFEVEKINNKKIVTMEVCGKLPINYSFEKPKCDCHSPETLAAEKVYSEVLAQNKKETTKRILAIK